MQRRKEGAKRTNHSVLYAFFAPLWQKNYSMKTLKILLAFVFFTLLITSCIKEEHPISNKPTETYDTARNFNYPGAYVSLYVPSYDQRYLYIQNDSVYTVFRDEWGVSFAIRARMSNDSTFFDTEGGKYTYTKRGKVLTETYNDDPQHRFYYGEADTIPTKDAIVKFAPVMDQFDQPAGHGGLVGGTTGLAFVDGKIYMALQDQYGYATLYGLDQNTKAIVDTIKVTFQGSNSIFDGRGPVCYANGFFWMLNDNAIEKINATTGQSVFRSGAIADSVFSLGGIAFDGNDLIVAVDYDNSTSEIYRYSIGGNSLSKIIDVPQMVQGLDYANGKLYISRYGSTARCNLNPFQIEMTYCYEIPDLVILGGLTHNGSDFWSKIEVSPGQQRVVKVKFD